MARHLVVGVLGMCGVLALLAPARAQAVLDDLYGQGVHSYFEGDLEGAINWLSEAIDQGTRDPRAYYFRGVAQLKLGDEQAAAADFARGAAIETDGSDQFFPIAESLARVQGGPRSRIEQARRDARKAAVEQRIARERARYEATIAAESRVLRGSQDNAVVQLDSTPDQAASFELPFPSEQTDASLEFSLDRISLISEQISSGALERGEAPEIVDPEIPAPTTPVRPAVSNPNGPAQPTDGPATAGGVLRGLFRTMSRSIPDPTQVAIPGVDLGGGSPDIMPEDFDSIPEEPLDGTFDPGN
ncbi:MAG: hypothetical protein KDA83_10835 [Planctomycetales bacterium]|nr:hypothetical protein [Planctomycetales bacterium]